MNEPMDTDAILDAIRHAAFELRADDPAEAVKRLRQLVKKSGPLEPLVQGALGEILLEEFDDVDGAIHHFQRLVTLAPQLPAGHIGLARSAARNGDTDAAQDAFARSQAGLEKVIEDARAPGASEALASTSGEALLTAMELALEERRFVEEYRTGRAASQVSAALLTWAEEARIFDDEDEELDDWMRYARLRAVLDQPLEAALTQVDRLAQHIPLPQDRAALVRSFAFEGAGKGREAAESAAAALTGLDDGAFEAEEVLRAVDLLITADLKAQADAIVAKLLQRLEASKADADDETRASIDELIHETRELAKQGGPRLVGLGKKG